MEDIKNYVSNKKPCDDLVELVLNFVIEHKLTKNNIYGIINEKLGILRDNSTLVLAYNKPFVLEHIKNTVKCSMKVMKMCVCLCPKGEE